MPDKPAERVQGVGSGAVVIAMDRKLLFEMPNPDGTLDLLCRFCCASVGKNLSERSLPIAREGHACREGEVLRTSSGKLR